MGQTNCWEYMNCGRQPGGDREEELGVCPAATLQALDGCNSGVNGGRSCWAIAGTLCDGTVQGMFAQKYYDCRRCEFYHRVRQEEGTGYTRPKELLLRLKKATGTIDTLKTNPENEDAIER